MLTNHINSFTEPPAKPVVIDCRCGCRRYDSHRTRMAVVAIGGLMTGTFLILLAVPVFHTMLALKHEQRQARKAALA